MPGPFNYAPTPGPQIGGNNVVVPPANDLTWQNLIQALDKIHPFGIGPGLGTLGQGAANAVTTQGRTPTDYAIMAVGLLLIFLGIIIAVIQTRPVQEFVGNAKEAATKAAMGAALA